MERKDFLKLVSTGAGILTLSPALLACQSENKGGPNPSVDAFSRPLSFPEEIRASEFELAAETARRKLAGGAASDVYTLNGSLPSPTIRVQRGDTLSIDYRNRIDQESIIHWHGLVVPPDMDGHPKDAVRPGQTYNYRFDIDQRAGTYWYHPHPDKLTGPQVYRGLGGFLLVEDEEEQALNLPSGEQELPFIIQEKQFNDRGQMVYSLNMMDRMMGYFGNTLLVNGMKAPYHEVSTRFYRLRLLNGSNARIMELALSDENPFYVIGNDGGLLDRPYEVSSVTLSPGERADLLVDFSRYKAGDTVRMSARLLNGMGGMMEDMMDRDGGGMMNGEVNMMERMQGMMGGNSNNSQNKGGAFLEFRITRETEDPFRLPQTLTELSFPDAADADRTRRIDLTMEMMQGSAINGRFFEMLRVDEKVSQGALEIWEFVNNTMMPHPMHIHVTHFKVLDRSGGSLAPHERGWKDTVRVDAGETVRVLTEFDAQEGLYVFHCHNLEHEDNGMMANFEIIS
ncbi:multicopper oxidase domain-containing protein [Aliifodinibius sp. S!AR15-10]|uniref:multicopper oxidase family protein n=1 Tax=Aliifodinibius sp. S!AR15-10 TaxID=2950437 RepID=UPI00285A7854|nr:multicopper oxidase domain-containing protein [Aliifodinibius sp. S!AR15-10]MDR8390482.1 multicopper oxidase domain-containing protein [Aliifodinibius sp. S!AR15-10]